MAQARLKEQLHCSEFDSTSANLHASMAPETEDVMAMKDATAVLTAMVDLIHERLNEAAEISKAAKACAGVGNIDEAIRITLAMDEPLYQATTLSNAAALIKRLADRDD